MRAFESKSEKSVVEFTDADFFAIHGRDSDIVISEVEFVGMFCDLEPRRVQRFEGFKRFKV